MAIPCREIDEIGRWTEAAARRLSALAADKFPGADFVPGFRGRLKRPARLCKWGKEGEINDIFRTRGQWPFRPAATRAMRNRHVMLHKSDMNLMYLKT